MKQKYFLRKETENIEVFGGKENNKLKFKTVCVTYKTFSGARSWIQNFEALKKIKGLDIQVMTKVTGVTDRTQLRKGTELQDIVTLNGFTQEENLEMETEARVQGSKK